MISHFSCQNVNFPAIYCNKTLSISHWALNNCQFGWKCPLIDWSHWDKSDSSNWCRNPIKIWIQKDYFWLMASCQSNRLSLPRASSMCSFLVIFYFSVSDLIGATGVEKLIKCAQLFPELSTSINAIVPFIEFTVHQVR